MSDIEKRKIKSVRAVVAEKYPPMRFPGETDEQYEARCEAESNKERLAEESRQEAERMSGPELSANYLKDNGEQTRIDMGRYHEWLAKNAPDANEMSAEDLRAVERANEAIEFFNSRPEAERKQYLETGDAGVFTKGMAEKIVNDTNREIGYLKDEGFFVQKEDGKGWTIDADFSAENVRGEAGSFDLKDESKQWFEQKSVEEQADLLWEQSATHEAFDRLPEEVRNGFSAEMMQAMKKDFVNKLSDEERNNLMNESLAEHQRAIEDWNQIPAERRASYMESGKIADLASNPDAFDAGSDEGRALIKDLKALEEMGMISFGNEAVIREPQNSRDAFQQALEEAERAKAESDAENAEKGKEEAFEAFKAKAEKWNWKNPDTGENYTEEELQGLFERSQVRKARQTELREKHGGELQGDSLKAEMTKLQAEDGDLSDEEAQALASLTEDERALHKRLKEMEEREARGESAETNFEGESKAKEYIVHDNANFVNEARFRTRKEAEEYLKGKSGDYRIIEEKNERIDFENDTPEEIREKLKSTYLRPQGMSQEEYDDYVSHIADEATRSEQSVRSETEEAEAEEPEEETVDEELEARKQNREKLLEWASEGKRDDLKNLMGASFELPENIADLSDDEVAELMKSINQAEQSRARFNELAENDEGFQAFLAEKHSSIAGEQAGREIISGQKAERIIDEWEEAKDGDILAVSTENSENAQEASRNLAEWMFNRKYEDGVKGLLKRYRTERIQKKYLEKAEELIETGDMSDRTWRQFDDVEDYMRDYWSRVDAIAPFKDVYRGKDGAVLLDGEAMTAYGIKLNEAGEKTVVKFGEEGETQEIALDSADEHEQTMAEVTLGLSTIMENFLASKGTAEDFEAMKSATRELSARLSEEGKAGWREDNFYNAVISARDSIRYGRSIDSLTEGLRFIDAQGGRSEERIALNRQMAERRAEKNRAERAEIEYLPNADGFRIDFNDAMAQLRNATEVVRNGQRPQDRSDLLDALGYLDMHRHRGLLFDEGRVEAEKEEYSRLRLEAMNVLTDGIQLDGRARSEALLAINKTVMDAERKNLSEVESEYGKQDYNIVLSENALESRGGENDWLYNKVIGDWNGMEGREQFRKMTGVGVDFRTMLLHDAGLLPMTAEEEMVSNSFNQEDNVVDVVSANEKRLGVEDWMPNTRVDNYGSDASLRFALNEAELADQTYDNETIRSAIDTWNNADALERRLYLVSLNKSYTEGREVAVANNVREAGEVLRDLKMLMPPASYGRTLIDTDAYDQVKENADASGATQLGEDYGTWLWTTPAQRRECIRSNGEAEGLDSGLVEAYRRLAEAGLVGEFMTNYS